MAVRLTGWLVKDNDKGLPLLGDVCDGPKGLDKLFKFQLGQVCGGARGLRHGPGAVGVGPVRKLSALPSNGRPSSASRAGAGPRAGASIR